MGRINQGFRFRKFVVKRWVDEGLARTEWIASALRRAPPGVQSFRSPQRHIPQGRLDHTLTFQDYEVYGKR